MRPYGFRVLFTFITIFVIINHSFSQEDTIKPKATFTLGSIICNNADYYGQVADEKMPYIALTGIVRFPSGIYTSALAYKITTDSNLISAGGVTAGYEFNIVKNVKADVSFSHTFYPENSLLLQASNPELLSGTLTYTHLWNTGMNFDYAFGKSNDYFTVLSNSKNFDFNTSKNKAVISITPQIDIAAGTQEFYETYITKKEKINNGKGKGATGSTGATTTVTTSYKKYDMLSYNFKLPVSYSRSHYMIEAALQLSALGSHAAANAGTVQSFFSVIAYYQF